MTKLFRLMAQANHARLSCKGSALAKFESVHAEVIDKLTKEYMPDGSGVDSGVTFSHSNSKTDHLVFNFSFHHMNEAGFYTNWTNHVLHVTPSLANGYDMRITGNNRNDIKEYFYQIFSHCLDMDVEQALNQEIS